MPRDRSFPLLLLCFFLSGLAALVYETAWTREFAFVFGTSELAVATVLAAYMGGLAAGAAAAGRFAARLRRPVLAYGLLELGIAVSALAVPLGITASRWLYVALFGGRATLPESGGLATSLFYLACSFAILLVPTAMMGATLPLLARHAVRRERDLGRRVGVLYAVNTIGAVAGTLLAAFALLPSLGLRLTVATAAGINALVFAAAWALARVAAPLAPEDAPAPRDAPARGRARWILALIAVSGFVSFSYEVTWVRLLAHVVGTGTSAFATMLASFLAGIALGAAVASRLATSASRAVVGFGVAQLGIAALSLAAFALVERLPDLLHDLQAGGAPSPWSDVVACMATLFPSALCIGATFPFAVRVLARGGEDAGPASARVYAANTLGAIAGSLAAGFFLVPGLGFAGTLCAAVAVNLALAAATAWLFAPRRPALAVAAVAGGVALAVLAPDTPWRMLRATSMGTGAGVGPWGEVAYFGVGRSSTVLLTDQRFSWGLWTNGLPEAGIPRTPHGQNRHALTRWLTALPVMARPETRTLLLVGLGGGMALEVLPDTLERVDVVELEPEVVAANRAVAAGRWRDPLADPRVHVHENDARNALLLSGQPFDAIVSQPSHPWSGGAAHLYTREFFALARDRLGDDGVFVQWIGLSFVDEPLFRSLLATLADVFPHVQAFLPPPEASVLFLASKAPLDVWESVPRALAASPEAFRHLGIDVADDVLPSLLLDEAGVAQLAGGAPHNRDGHNRLQSRSGRLAPGETLRPAIGAWIAPLDPLVDRRPPGSDVFYVLRRLGPARAARVAAALPDPLDRLIGEALAGIEAGKRLGPRRKLEEALAEAPRHAEARAAMLRLSAGAIAEGRDPAERVPPPFSEAERALIDGWRARAADESGPALEALEPALAAIPHRHPLATDALRLRVQGRLRSGDPARIAEAIALADAGLGDRPDAGSILLRAETLAAAGEQHAAVLETLGELILRLDPREPATRARMQRALALARATSPEDPALQRLRDSTLQRLGGRAGEYRPLRRAAARDADAS